MNEQRQPNDFDPNKDDDETVTPEQRPLAEHLEGITSKSNGVEVKAAAESALADSWSRADVKKALEALGVGAGRIRQALPPPSRPRAPASEGLSPDYFREQADGPVFCFMAATRGGDFTPVLVCSPVKALHRTSDPDGDGWALEVRVTDERGVKHDVKLPYAEIAIEPSAAVGRMAARGLRTHTKPEIVLGAVKDANGLKRAYILRTPGHHTVGGKRIFVMPAQDGVIGETSPDDLALWGGNAPFCRPRQAGTMDGWIANVVEPLDGYPIPMAMLGLMLASPAIPFLPPAAESNTVIHLYGDNTSGKTTSMQCGASAWGKGSKPEDPKSFINTWKSTMNNTESISRSAHHIGCCVDEIKLFDPKTASSLGYLFASGRGKGRMNADGTARKVETWSAFFASSGERKCDEIGPSDGRRRAPPDGGAAVRFIDLPAHVVFPDFKQREEAEAFVARLGVAASTDYGHAGPAFAAWLIANPTTAKSMLAGTWCEWAELTKKILPPMPSNQAARMASRLGSIACGAALGAAVLKLPWSTGARTKEPGSAQAAESILWAFGKVLKIWLDANGGGGASTEIVELIEAMDNFIATRQRHFVRLKASAVLAPGGVETETIDVNDKYPATPRWGWIKMRKVGDGEEVEYLDLSPAIFTDAQGLGWEATKRDRLMRELKNRGLLIISPGRPYQLKCRREGKSDWFYRIKGEHFNE